MEPQSKLIYVSDSKEGIKVLKYNLKTGLLYTFADSLLRQQIQRFVNLDQSTLAYVDKLGNFCIQRVSKDSENDAEDDPVISRLKWEQGNYGGSLSKLQVTNNYYIGEAGTSLAVIVNEATGQESVIVSTASGSLVTFKPITSQYDINLFNTLQQKA